MEPRPLSMATAYPRVKRYYAQKPKYCIVLPQIKQPYLTLDPDTGLQWMGFRCRLDYENLLTVVGTHSTLRTEWYDCTYSFSNRF